MRFICDNTLGKLTKYLRILGFDTVSINDLDMLNRYKNQDDPPSSLHKKDENNLIPADNLHSVKPDSGTNQRNRKQHQTIYQQ